MSDFINKIISVVLVFIMLVLAPLLISYKSDNMLDSRCILNDVGTFLDKVTDVASITEDDLNKLYLECNSYGMAVDVKVKVMMKAAVPLSDDEVRYAYYGLTKLEDIENLRKGDVVTVHVEEIGISGLRRFQYSILGYEDGVFKFDLAKSVV